MEYLEIVKELYSAIIKGELNEKTFYELPEKIDKLDFSAAIECLCAYMKVLIDRNDVDHIIPIVDNIIRENGGMLNVFFINVVMDIALNCFNNGKDYRAAEYIHWLCGCVAEVGDPGGINRDKLRVLALLSDCNDLRNMLYNISTKCCLEGKKVYAEIFGEFKVTTADYKDVKWRTAKTKDIMAYFVCLDGKGASKNRIIQNVWGEEPSKALTPIFNTSMYNLRKSLGQGENGEILFNDGMYYIDKEAVGSDYALFKAAAEDFNGDKNIYNALRVLSWFNPSIMDGVDGVFIAPVRRECFKTAKEAIYTLCKDGAKELASNIIGKWNGGQNAELFTAECRKMAEN